LECGDWGEAFMKVMPKRKGGKLREEEGDKNEGGEDPADAEEDIAEAGADEELELEEQASNAAEVEATEETPDVTMTAAS
jgi:tRNA (guanine9-N1)-methyltransferase